MRNPYWLSDVQMARLKPFLAKGHVCLKVDGGPVQGGIIFINVNFLRSCDLPEDDCPHKTVAKRCRDKRAFAWIMAGIGNGLIVSSWAVRQFDRLPFLSRGRK